MSLATTAPSPQQPPTPSALTTLVEMFLDPMRAFARTLSDGRAWVPLLLVLGGTAAIYALYFGTVDFDWFVGHLLDQHPDFSDDQRETTRQLLSPGSLATSTLAVTLLLTPALFALFALYFLLVSQVLGHRVRYGKWFAFCVWCAVPRLAVYPLMLFQIATSHGQVAIEDLSMVSFSFLLLRDAAHSAWAGWAGAIDLTVLWSAFLGVVGFRVWTAESWRTSVAVGLLPYLAIYGLWALRIALSGGAS